MQVHRAVLLAFVGPCPPGSDSWLLSHNHPARPAHVGRGRREGGSTRQDPESLDREADAYGDPVEVFDPTEFIAEDDEL
jgi:hypothetical protein